MASFPVVSSFRSREMPVSAALVEIVRGACNERCIALVDVMWGEGG
jgi:hypothetical protein